MDTLDQLTRISADMAVEIDSEPSVSAALAQFAPPDCVPGRSLTISDLPVQHACLPGGRTIPVLKTVLTSVCERNCNYCCFRSGRDTERFTFKPDELAKVVVQLHQQGVIRGTFLSSGVAGGGIRTQDRLIDTAEILRTKMGYRGYIHLKIMPGAERAQVERAMQLADRVSINLEGPNTRRLALLAPMKVFMEELLAPMRWVEEIRQTQPPHLGWNGRWPSTTTQFVVGAVGENDLELLQTTAYLTRNLHLARGYFSGFRPVDRTPFEERAPVNQVRVNRLYQASFLLRDYEFELEEMPFVGSGDLPLEVDPKLGWARQNLGEAPVEVNRANRRELLHIPGFGPKAVRSILEYRRRHPLHNIEDLKALGIQVNRAVPFILINGRRPAMQMALW
ncbi:MAG TPA: radical SAM protein [Anaerolineaceae bacterium]